MTKNLIFAYFKNFQGYLSITLLCGNDILLPILPTASAYFLLTNVPIGNVKNISDA